MVARSSPAATALVLALCCSAAITCSSTVKKHEAAGPGDREVQGGPLKIESTVWQFGTLKRGETATHMMRLTNEGDGRLTLSVHSSCDCLTAELDDYVLPAGETAELRLAFVGETIKKKLTKTIYIDAAEPAAQRIEVWVTGEVTRGDGPHLHAVPTMLLIKKGAQTYEPGLLRISNQGRSELSVAEVRCFGCVASRTSFSLGADDEIEIEVDIAEEWTQEGRWLEIDSNDPVEATKKIPLVVME